MCVRKVLGMTRQEYIDYFTKMEYEEANNGPLDGAEWDDVAWQLFHATETDKLFTDEELREMFPKLLGHVVEVEVKTEPVIDWGFVE